MKKFVLLISLFALASCSKSNNEISKNLESCDYVNMLDRYGLNTTEKADWNWDVARNCILKYGNLNDFDKGMMLEAKEIPILMQYGGDKALENALKECTSNTVATTEQKQMACDCYNVSVPMAGPYDNLSASQKTLREKCNKIFAGNDELMKRICNNK